MEAMVEALSSLGSTSRYRLSGTFAPFAATQSADRDFLCQDFDGRQVKSKPFLYAVFPLCPNFDNVGRHAHCDRRPLSRKLRYLRIILPTELQLGSGHPSHCPTVTQNPATHGLLLQASLPSLDLGRDCFAFAYFELRTLNVLDMIPFAKSTLGWNRSPAA